MSENKHSLWTAKVSVWHIVYIILICGLIILFFLLLAPGKINDEAYHNFAFAATITSIVLAVVSIVYSIQSGISSLGHISRIHDIEESLSNEVSKFSGIDEAIRDALSPLSQKMGDLQKAQDSMKIAQDSLYEQVSKFNETIIETKVNVSGDNQITIAGPEILYVVLYAAAKSQETTMDLPYHKFAEVVGPQARYCEGLLDGLAAINQEKLKVEQGSSSTRKKVTVFDETYWGTKDHWRQEAEKIHNGKIAKGLLSRIDDYYSDIKNQIPADSI